jgi:hypothetical protein
MALKSSTSLTYASSRQNSSINVPANAAIGDIAILGFYVESTTVPTPPTGFELKYTIQVDTDNLHRIYWKRLTAADSGTYDFGHSSLGTAATCDLYDGRVKEGDPFDQEDDAIEDSYNGGFPDVAITPSVDNCDIVYMCSNYYGTAVSPPSGYEEGGDSTQNESAWVSQTTATATGNVASSTSASYTSSIIFSLLPEEYEGGIVVTESSGVIDVTCDGFNLTFNDSDTNYDIFRLEALDLSTYFVTLRSQLAVSSTTYIGGYGKLSLDIVSQSPIYTHVRLKTNYSSTSGNANTLQDSGSADVVAIFDFHIYPDRFFVSVTFEIENTLTLDNSTANRVFYAYGNVGSLTNEINIAEISGVEKYHEEDGAGNPDLVGVVVTGDYLGFTSDEVNFQVVPVNESISGTATHDWYFNNVTYVYNRLYNGTVADGDNIVAAYIIDSEERSLGAKAYSDTERLEMGDQYTDLYLTT